MPSLHSLVIRRAAPMDMGTAASSVSTMNPSSKANNSSSTSGSSSSQKKGEKSSSKLSGIRLPLLRKESSAVNLSLAERSMNKRSGEAPLLRPESSASLEARGNSWINLGPTALRKCETAVGLSTLALEGRPVNRSRVCSRCSSLLSLASSSRYSLAAGNFVPAATSQQHIAGRFLCKLCLADVTLSQTFTIEGCGCSYCKDVRILILFVIISLSKIFYRVYMNV